MADLTDHDLILEYARTGAEASFQELVHRHIDFVYSTALRVLHDSSMAEDVTQRVFVALGRNASKLQDRATLIGWLHDTARNFAVTTIRSEERRRRREQEAATMNAMDLENSEALWKQIAPFLDEALTQLHSDDRDLLLWRYFERKTALQIGDRLGLSGDAAQKRVARALERLRNVLADRGLAIPVTGLAIVLSSQAVQSAPIGLAASAIAAVGLAGAGSSTTSTVEIIMASIKTKIGLAAALAVGVSIPLVLQYQRNSQLAGELTTLRQQGSELDRLRKEIERLTIEARSASDQRDKDGAALARLRAEVASFKAREGKDSRGTKGAPPAGHNEKVVASEPSSGGLVLRESWRNVGFQVPSSSVQTLEWAKVNGQTNVTANGLAWADEQTRAEIESIFAAAPETVRAKYGSADAYILGLFDHSGPQDDRHSLTSYRILNETITGDEALLNMEYNYADGTSHTFDRRYLLIGGNWRQAMDFDAPSQNKLSIGLQAETPAPVDPAAEK